ncbi:MAG TPA: hypothetical protein VH598_05870, partial [Verrucomicrobiae bacterium]|nr:hypothetical protein [Verrucomicrobiae bacterium]
LMHPHERGADGAARHPYHLKKLRCAPGAQKRDCAWQGRNQAKEEIKKQGNSTMRIGAPASGITAARQVLTPRTKISKPALGPVLIALLKAASHRAIIFARKSYSQFIHKRLVFSG